LEEFQLNTQEVLSKNTALAITDVLSDEKARIPTFGAHSVLFIPGKEVAVKTGTTNNNKDAWTIGYTPSLAVGVWAGNNDNQPMKKGGAAVAGPIWNKFINEALKTLPDEKFEKPNLDFDPKLVKPALRGFWQGNENFFIDQISKKLAGPNTPRETIQEKVVTNVHSILYWVNKNDILGESPTNPEKDSQFEHWEIPVQNWWTQNKEEYQRKNGIITINDKPSAVDNAHIDSMKPIISIIEPNINTIYLPSQKINLKITSSGPYPLTRIDIFINDVYLGTHNPLLPFSFVPKELEGTQKNNELKVVVYDSIYNSNETTLIFKVQE